MVIDLKTLYGAEATEQQKRYEELSAYFAEEFPILFSAPLYMETTQKESLFAKTQALKTSKSSPFMTLPV